MESKKKGEAAPSSVDRDSEIEKDAETAAAPKIDERLVEKAVSALIQHHEKTNNKNQLLGNDDIVQVQLSLQAPPVRHTARPLRLEIPHSFRNVKPMPGTESYCDDDDDDLEEPEVCLIVKEDAKPWVQEMIAEFPEQLGVVKKVLGLESLRKKHQNRQQQKTLLNKYSVFMVDARILPMVGSLLSSSFYKKKKQPIPIPFRRKIKIPYHIVWALQSTHMTLNRGTCITIPAGRTNMPVQKLAKNILAIARKAPTKVPRSWSNVRSMHIKTPSSVALPFYHKTPAELQQLALDAGVEPFFKELTEEEESAAKEKTRKRELKDKSPLVRALKKSKEEEEEDDDNKQKKEEQEGGASRKSKKEEKAKKPARSSDTSDDEEEEEEETRESEAGQDSDDASLEDNEEDKAMQREERDDDATTGSKKAKKTDAKKELDDAEEAKPDKKKKKKKDKKRKGSDADPDMQESDGGKDESPKKMAKMGKKKASTKDAEPEEEEEDAPEYIPSMCFTRSRNGYVFKKGRRGLGYYRDHKPVVDKVALEAVLRSSENSKKGRGKGKKQRRGRR